MLLVSLMRNTKSFNVIASSMQLCTETKPGSFVNLAGKVERKNTFIMRLNVKIEKVKREKRL